MTGEELQKAVVNFCLEKEIFSPEFLNRFDGVVVYTPLELPELIKIAKLMLSDLSENLKTKGIELVTPEATYEKLARDGYDPAYGARAMRRLVNITLGDLISRAIISGEIKEGDRVKLTPGTKLTEFFIEKI
jgi:ATP-dependent Clp protease ATP-binding subunit ClpC